MTIVLDGLEDSFDNDRAEEMLNLSVGKITHTSEIVRKSMYDFDLETPEGIQKLMALLPIMDPEILKDIMTEIWPGYPTDIDARRHRLEIKGFLKDYLESYDQENAGDELTGSEGEEGVEGREDSTDSSTQLGSTSTGVSAEVGGTPTKGTTQPGAVEQTKVAQTAGA